MAVMQLAVQAVQVLTSHIYVVCRRDAAVASRQRWSTFLHLSALFRAGIHMQDLIRINLLFVIFFYIIFNINSC